MGKKLHSIRAWVSWSLLDLYFRMRWSVPWKFLFFSIDTRVTCSNEDICSIEVYLWSDYSQQWRGRVTSSIRCSFFWEDSLNLEFCYLGNTLLDSCTVHSLRFPFFCALLLSKDRILPFILLLHGHQCRSFLVASTLTSNISHSLAFSVAPSPTLSLHTHSWLLVSPQYNHALGSVISKNSHSETNLSPPFLPHLTSSPHLSSLSTLNNCCHRFRE